MSENAMKGFIRTYDRLIKTADGINFTDRYQDLLKLFKAESSGNGKTALKESLENFKAVTDDLVPGDKAIFKFVDIDNVADKLTRYQSWDPRFAADGTPNLTNKLDPEIFPKKSIYASLNDLGSPTNAKSSAQLPDSNSAIYKLEIQTSPVKTQCQVPYGDYQVSEVIEPVARDFLTQGVGGATQVAIKGEPVTISRLYKWLDGVWEELPLN